MKEGLLDALRSGRFGSTREPLRIFTYMFQGEPCKELEEMLLIRAKKPWESGTQAINPWLSIDPWLWYEEWKGSQLTTLWETSGLPEDSPRIPGRTLYW